MKSHRLIRKLDFSKDSNKDIALRYDAGEIESKKYGKATLSGHFLLLTRHGEFPAVNEKEVEERSYKWLNEMGLQKHQDNVIEKFKIPYMIAHTAPNTNPDKLELYFKTMVFGFIFDDAIVQLDHHNENNPVKQQEDVSSLAKNLISIIESRGNANCTEAAASKLNYKFKPLCEALSNLCSCTSDQINRDDYKLFARDVMDFIRGYKWMQEHHNSPYNENEFLILRYINVLMGPVFAFLCLAKDIHISDEVRMHPLFQRYYKNVVLHEALRNDIISLEKEIADKEVKNYVLIKCRKYSLQRSIYKAEKVATELIIDVKRDAIKLKSYFPADENLKKFIETAEYALDGFLFWYRSSKRYGNITWETYVVEYDCDYNNWLEGIGINNLEYMIEPVLRFDSNNDTVVLPSYLSLY